MGLGDSEGVQRDLEKGIDLLQKSKEPRTPKFRIKLGRLQYSKKDYGETTISFTKAIELNPNYVRTYLNRGYSYHKKGEYDEAIKDFTKAIELNPDYALAYWRHYLRYGFFEIKQDLLENN